MTRDDIVRMAREAGKDISQEHGFVPFLERFAALVAAAEREKLKHELLTLEKWKGMALTKDGDGRTVQEIEREARAAEREACAKVCEEWLHGEWHNQGVIAAMMIRERGAP